MTELHDLLLTRPVSDPWLRFLLFFLFSLHLFFVLIMLGTAAIGVYYFLHSYWTGEYFEHRWDKKIHHKFLAAKALAVVLGVGPLLVIQVYFSIPFYTANTFWGFFWLLAFPLMIVSFIFIDFISHKEDVHPIASLVLGIIGLFLLFCIPAIFVLVLVTMENSNQWIDIVHRNFHFDLRLTMHWLMRFLHIMGASLAFGAAYQFFITTGHHDYRKRRLIRWIIVGMLIQFASGGMLALTIQEWISFWTFVPLAVSIVLAAIVVWILFVEVARAEPHAAPVLGATAYLLPILLIGMLLVRQFIQNQKVLPLLAKSQQNAAEYRQKVDAYLSTANAAFTGHLDTPYNNGQTIYNNACAFCHGLDGSGNSPEAAGLLIPPERIAESRASRAWIYAVLVNGYPGAGMPYFSVFDKYKLEDLIKTLDDRFQILSPPGPLPVKVSPQDQARAEKEFNVTCSLCHNLDGRGVADYSKNIRPAPPDFTLYNLRPQRAFEVIRDGYPGTAMRSFAGLPDQVRWGLVHKVNSFFNPGPDDNATNPDRLFHTLTYPEK